MPRDNKVSRNIPTLSHDATQQSRSAQAYEPRSRRSRPQGRRAQDLFEGAPEAIPGLGAQQATARPLRLTRQGAFALLTLAIASRFGAAAARPAPFAGLAPAPWTPDALLPSGPAAALAPAPWTASALVPTSAPIAQGAPPPLPQIVDTRALSVKTGTQRSFVQTSGTQLTLDGQPFYFGGTNAFSLAMVNRYSEDEVRSTLQTHAQKGARVIRFFAFSNGDGADDIPMPTPIQPSIGTFQEEALKRMDLVLAEAANNDLRVVMPMVNFEPELGGMQWYVDQIKGAGQAKELFYTDTDVQNAYKAYVSTLVNRVNTVNGVRYGDDPTILSWELANEPHTTNQYEQNLGLPPGKIVRDWLSEMSGFVRGLGVQQLISTGEEGYRADGDTSPPNNNWINGGYKGVDFVDNIALANISFATVHVYPDNWAISADDYSWVDPNFITDRANIAHAVNKPIIMEECGMKLGYLPQRDTLLQFFSDAAVRNNYAGLMVWQVWPDNQGSSGYDFGYGEQGGDEMVKIYDVMRNRS